MSITSEAIVDSLKIEGVQLSPCGLRVVYSTKPIGRKGDAMVSTLWIAEVTKEHSARPLLKDMSGDYNDRQPRWSPDGKKIAFLSNRGVKGACVVSLVSSEGEEEPRPLTSARCKEQISVFDWSPDGKKIAFLSPDEKSEEQSEKEKTKDDAIVYGANEKYNRLRLTNVTDVGDNIVKVLFAEEKHVSTFAWSPAGDDIAFTTHEDSGMESPMSKGVHFYTISASGGAAASICFYPTEMQQFGRGLVWLEDKIYFIGNTAVEKPYSAKALYELSLKDKTFALKRFGESNCARAMTSMKGSGALAIMIGDNLHEEVHTLTDVLLSVDREIDDTMFLGWDAFESPSVSHIAYSQSSVSTPAELFVTFTADNTTRKLSNNDSSSLFHEAELAQMQTITCKTDGRDGAPVFDIYALFASPTISDVSTAPDTSTRTRGPPWPTVVVVHGGPYHRSVDSFNAGSHAMVPALLATGKYAVFLPNYRGSSCRGAAFAAAIRGEAGMVDYDDILSLVDEGIAHNLIDPRRIVVFGWSWGGMLSMLASVRSGQDSAGNSKSWRWRGAISGAGSSDGDMAALTANMYSLREATMGALPWNSDAYDLTGRRGSAIWMMKNAVQEKRMPPVLLFHGAQDYGVSPDQSKAFWRACKYHETPCELVLYPRESHGFIERQHIIDLHSRVLGFIEQHTL